MTPLMLICEYHSVIFAHISKACGEDHAQVAKIFLHKKAFVDEVDVHAIVLCESVSFVSKILTHVLFERWLECTSLWLDCFGCLLQSSI